MDDKSILTHAIHFFVFLETPDRLNPKREQHLPKIHPGTLPIYQPQIAATLSPLNKIRRRGGNERVRLVKATHI